jgi:hypothetical protein
VAECVSYPSSTRLEGAQSPRRERLAPLDQVERLAVARSKRFRRAAPDDATAIEGAIDADTARAARDLSRSNGLVVEVLSATSGDWRTTEDDFEKAVADPQMRCSIRPYAEVAKRTETPS